jgi:hypothetical protein
VYGSTFLLEWLDREVLTSAAARHLASRAQECLTPCRQSVRGAGQTVSGTRRSATSMS